MPHWTNFSYHEGHSMGSAPRRSDSWLPGSSSSSNQGPSPGPGPALLPQRSTLNTNRPATMGKAGLSTNNRGGPGSINLIPGPGGVLISQNTSGGPGPGSYGTSVPSTLRKGGVSFKGGSMRGNGACRVCVLDSKHTSLNLQAPNKSSDGGPNGDNGTTPRSQQYYQKVSTFGEKKSRGGAIPRAGRKIDWMDPKDNTGAALNTTGRTSSSKVTYTSNSKNNKNNATGQGPSLYMPKSTLASNQTARIGATPRFREAAITEAAASQTPGPGHYVNSAKTHSAIGSRGVSFKRGSKNDPIALGKSAYSWYNANDTPGPAAYEPMSHAEHKKKRVQESYMNTLSKLSTARGSIGMSVPQSARSSGPGTARKTFEFTPRVRQ